MATKLLYYDLETTGTDPRKHGIHQLAGYVESDGRIVETFNISMQPNPKAIIDSQALKIAGIDESDFWLYPTMAEAFHEFHVLLDRHVKAGDPRDRLWQVGFNNRAFDDIFLRAWFAQNGHPMYMAYFYPESIDVMVLAGYFLQGTDVRADMKRFTLSSVARALGIEVDPGKTHDALYDIHLTREIYIHIDRALRPRTTFYKHGSP